MNRRNLLTGVLMAGTAGAAGGAGSAAEKPVAEKPADPNAVTPDDLAVLDRITGRSRTAAEHTQMAPRVQGTREGLVALRAAAPDAVGEAPALRFDPRVPGHPVPGPGKSLLKLARRPVETYDGHPESLAFAPITTLCRLLKTGKVTSVELTRMYLHRLKRFGPRLHCVINLCEERALEQAARADREISAGKWRGPLHGVPYGAKDLLATRGIPTTYGVKPYEKQMLPEDATVVRRLEAAGAVLLAKLSMGELAMGDVWFGGRTRNPWDSRRGSSGSSAGSGSATAAGLVPFAIGTETLGSIVSPACENGVTGLRPTYGRISRHGAMALSWSMDKIGPLCRSVEDAAIVLSALAGPDGLDLSVADVPFRWEPDQVKLSDLRIGIDQAGFDSVKDEHERELYLDVLSVFRGRGVELTPVHLPERTDAYRALAGITIDVEGAASFERLDASGGYPQLVQQGAGSWPNVFRSAATVPGADYLQAQRLRSRLQREMAEALQHVDLYLAVPFAGPTLVYTNLTGHPSLVTRCGMVKGLPRMVEFIGQLYREDAILRAGLEFERATKHHLHWPDEEALPENPPGN